MADNKNVNYTNNDGAKYRYSASGNKKENAPKKAPKIKEALTRRAVFWKTNRTFAIIVLVAALLLFSALSIFRAVRRSASFAEDYYAEAGIEKSIGSMISYSKSLASLNETLNPESGNNSECRSLAERLDGEKSTPFWADPDLAKKLFDKTEKLYNEIYYGNASAEAKRDAKDLFESFDGAYRSLGNSLDYAEAASDYNEDASRFPANLFKTERAPVFEHYKTDDAEDQTGIQELDDDEDDGNFISNFVSRIVKTVKSIFSGFSAVQIIAIAVGIIILIKVLKGRNR